MDRSVDDRTPTSVRIAIVLYENSLAEVWRCLRSLRQSVRRVVDNPSITLNAVTLRLGDCSHRPVLRAEDDLAIKTFLSPVVDAEYIWFGENLGHSAGCNALAEDAVEDAVLFLNPDTYSAPALLEELLGSMRSPKVAAVDARQIPCEHPKWYDPTTGEQSWASGACVLLRTPSFHAVAGFDAQSFPSYVNDVDLSWRLRLHGGQVVHQPDAVVFHDKRLDSVAGVRPTSIEFYAGLMGRLMLATKYDRPDIVEETLTVVSAHGNDDQRRAAAEFVRIREADSLPDPLPAADSVAEFVDGEYGRRRY